MVTLLDIENALTGIQNVRAFMDFLEKVIEVSYSNDNYEAIKDIITIITPWDEDIRKCAEIINNQ